MNSWLQAEQTFLLHGLLDPLRDWSWSFQDQKKRKRDELIESDADEHDIDDEFESVDMDEAYGKLVSEDKTPEKPAEDEDKVLAELSKIYDSEGTVNDPVSWKLANLVRARTTLKKSWENTTDLRIVKT